MRVAIIGSYVPGERWKLLGSYEAFAAAVSQVADQLIRRGHEILVVEPVDGSADKVVLDYLSTRPNPSSNRLVRVLLHSVTRDEVAMRWPALLPWCEVTTSDKPGPIVAAENSDAIVCIAGRDGTITASVVAFSTNLPVLPIPMFGGGSALVNNTRRAELERMWSAPYLKIFDADAWGKEQCDAIADLDTRIDDWKASRLTERRLRGAIGTILLLAVVGTTVFGVHSAVSALYPAISATSVSIAFGVVQAVLIVALSWLLGPTESSKISQRVLGGALDLVSVSWARTLLVGAISCVVSALSVAVGNSAHASIRADCPVGDTSVHWQNLNGPATSNCEGGHADLRIFFPFSSFFLERYDSVVAEPSETRLEYNPSRREFLKHQTAAPATPAMGASLEKCIQEAKKRQRPYVIESLTSIVDIDQVASVRAVRWRQVYTIRALQDIVSADSHFQEWYSVSSPDKTQWPGSETEELIVNQPTSDLKYKLEFDLKMGEVRAVTTGVDLRYGLPVKKTEIPLLTLGADEDFFAYPNNESDGDVICDSAMLITSRTHLVAGASAHRISGSVATSSKPITQSAPNGYSTASAHWSSLLPGETIAVKFQLGAATTTGQGLPR